MTDSRTGYQPTAPSGPTEHLALAAQPTAIPVAAMFVRDVLRKWCRPDLIADVERATDALTTGFVTAIEAHRSAHPTRMTVCIRAVGGRVVVELYDSPENAALAEDAGRSISEGLERIGVRHGRYRAGGHTVSWCEIGQPQRRFTPGRPAAASNHQHTPTSTEALGELSWNSPQGHGCGRTNATPSTRSAPNWTPPGRDVDERR
ncbi:hypothetical protein [Nocardia sp. CNY236]|uniref:hypothetical protein n=1 Tax=Nocardia sp. CNY236 TaxID=1169152 RepID=UPI0003F71869|nr:hypothetical protein [Nocardia sp. CNY236]